MKVFQSCAVLLALLGLVRADDDWWNPANKFNKWAKMKALVSCYGEKAMEQWHVKHKKALKTCSGMPVPELDLHHKMKPYRMIDAMLKGMEDKHENNMYNMFKSMGQHRSGPQIHVVPVQTQNSDSDFMEKMMKMMMMKKMMKKMHGASHDSDDHDQYEMMEKMMRNSNNDDDMSGMQKMFEMFKNQNRYKRDTDLYDLGDKLVEKLEMAKDAFQAKAGNISCYLQEFNYIDEDMNLNLQGMLQEADSYDWQGNEWLHEKNKQGIKDCYDMVQSIPKNLLEHYGNEKHMRVKKFMMCNDHMMKMECMCDDAKKMLEKHFKPLSELVQETGMDEMSLLKMTHMLVEDSMDF